MKKFMRGLMGETRGLLDGRGKLTLSNLQYYENLKQALDHLQNDDRYILYFWDFRKYYPHTRPEDTSDIIKREFSLSDEIYKKNLIVSLEHGVFSNKREIYIRQHKDSTKYLNILDVLTPAEQLINEQKGHPPSRHVLSFESGTYSKDKKILYILGQPAMAKAQQDNVMGYVERIHRFFGSYP